MLTETWFSGFFPNRGTIRPLALVSPGPLSATKRKSVLLPQTSCAVRTGFSHPLVSVCILLITGATSCCTRRRRKPLTSWASKSCPPSRACRKNTPSCYRRKRRRMPNTGVRAMRCASCCSTSRTWIVCWSRMSAARKRNRSMIASNGHAPKAFRRNAQPHIYVCSKGFRGAAPDKQRAVFAAAEIARHVCYVCYVCKFGLKITLLS